jgi:hypothetical protein
MDFRTSPTNNANFIARNSPNMTPQIRPQQPHNQYMLQSKFPLQQNDFYQQPQMRFNTSPKSLLDQNTSHQKPFYQPPFDVPPEPTFHQYQGGIAPKPINFQQTPFETVKYWLHSHGEDAQPSDDEIQLLMLKTGLSREQIRNFIDTERAKNWKNQVVEVEPHEYLKTDSSDDENNVNTTLDTSAEINHILDDDEENDDDKDGKLGIHANAGNLPKNAVETLKDWLFGHFLHPYPTDEEKAVLASSTKLNLTQVNNWFINARRRIWRPIIKKQQSQLGNEIVVTTSASGAAAIQKLQQHQPGFMTSMSPDGTSPRAENAPFDDLDSSLKYSVLDSQSSRIELKRDIQQLKNDKEMIKENIAKVVRSCQQSFDDLCSRSDFLEGKVFDLEENSKLLKESNKKLSRNAISLHSGLMKNLQVRKSWKFNCIEHLYYNDEEEKRADTKSAFKEFKHDSSWVPTIKEFSVGFFAGPFEESETSDEKPKKKRKTREDTKEKKEKRKKKDSTDTEKKESKKRKTTI